ncbi:TPA: hypothetical protein EYP70_06225 [Candidatus Bathyarchaeota archaeon]|nr:hypothetical protein [Candidatus Bathyarchaeota archaeon]
MKQECVWLHRFQSFEEVEGIILRWIQYYKRERLHSSRGYLTPENGEINFISPLTA